MNKSGVSFGGGRLSAGFFVYLAVFIFYLSMVSGGVIPLTNEGIEKPLVKILVLVLFLIVLVAWRRYLFGKTLLAVFGVSSAAILLVASFGTEDVTYAIEKLDAVVFGSVLASALLIMLVRRLGFHVFLSVLINVGVIILLLTVAYKYNYGFFDRNVRFFLNGANVFGWLMGLFAISSLYMVLNGGRKSYLLFAGVFLSAVVWSESKGALISSVMSLFLLGLLGIRGAKYLMFIFLVIPSLVLVTPNLISAVSYYFPESRVLAIVRVMEGAVSEVDEGSISVRQYLLNDAIEAFQEKPLMGIGLGNFNQYSSLGFDYPHNAHVEVFMECGVFSGLLYLCFVIFGLIRSPLFFRIVAIYFLFASAFSGDIGYLRYAFVFILSGLVFSRGIPLEVGRSSGFVAERGIRENVIG